MPDSTTDLAAYLRALVDYDAASNEQLLDAAAGLSDADLDASYGPGFPTIRANLSHMLTAQNVWLSRWTRKPPAPANASSLDELRATFEASHAAIRAYVGARTAEDLVAPVEYVDSRGVAHAERLWVLVAHVVNHGTHHRAETGLLLAAHGRSPGDMDFVYWARDHGL